VQKPIKQITNEEPRLMEVTDIHFLQDVIVVFDSLYSVKQPFAKLGQICLSRNKLMLIKTLIPLVSADNIAAKK
jgi:hypothetical protein